MSKKIVAKNKPKRIPPFSDPEFHRKAIAKAAITPKPKHYRSKKVRIDEVKKEIIREELLRSGFIDEVGRVLPKINKALILSASNPRFQSSADRKIVYSALGILGKDERETARSIGEVLAALANKK